MNECTILNKEYIKPFLPPRKRDCNKGDFGKLLLITSCKAMSGASVIASRAALRSGAGLVYVASAESAVLPVQLSVPEAITLPLFETSEGKISSQNADFLIEKANCCSAVVIGCGLSVCKDTKQLVRKLLRKVNVPIVLDADGINIAAQDINILKNTSAPVILTPHLKEMSRLCGREICDIKENKEEIASEFSREYGVTVVLKDFQTVISVPNGAIYKNLGGHPCMAKGGSGDMLAAMIGAFLAQGLSYESAACSAVFLHARAGELCGEAMGDYSVLASDLIERLPQVFKELK